jgi:hypothetical protein
MVPQAMALRAQTQLLPPVPPKAKAKAGAKAAAKESSQKASGSRIRSWAKGVSKLFKGGAVAWCLLAMVILWSGREGPMAQLTLMLKSTAEVTRAAGGAAVLLLDTGTGLTSSARNAVVSFASSSIGAVQLAWHGVDLLDVKLTASRGRIVAADGSELSQWLQGGGAASVTRAKAATLASWADQAESTSLAMPALAAQHEEFDEHGTYYLAEGTSSLARSGHVVHDYRVIQASFATRWANPLWQLLDIDISAEGAQVREALGLVMERLNNSQPVHTFIEIDHDCLQARLRLIGRRLYFVLRAILLELCALRGGGSLLAFTWACHRWWHEFKTAFTVSWVWSCAKLGSISGLLRAMLGGGCRWCICGWQRSKSSAAEGWNFTVLHISQAFRKSCPSDGFELVIAAPAGSLVSEQATSADS